MVAWFEYSTRLSPDHHRAGRNSSGERLCSSQYIWLDAIELVGKGLSGSSHTTLHFIVDEQKIVLITELSHSLKEGRICWNNTTFTLDGLHDDGTGMLVNERF